MKFFIVINLWIFLFTQFFVLIPVSAYAATPNVAENVVAQKSDTNTQPILKPEDMKISEESKNVLKGSKDYSITPKVVSENPAEIATSIQNVVIEQTIDNAGRVVESIPLKQNEVDQVTTLQKQISNSELLSGNSSKKIQVKQKTEFKTFESKNNSFRLQYLDGVDINIDGAIIKLVPVTNRKLKAEKYLDGVIYRNVWKDIDVYYELSNNTVKEFIYVRSQNASIDQIQFQITGADFVNKDGVEFLKVPNSTKQLQILPYTIFRSDFGPVENVSQIISSNYTEKIQKVSIDKSWFSSLTKESFPLVIDPTIVEGIVNGDATNATYRAVNSRGYICEPWECDLYIGSKIFSGSTSWSWRSEIFIPYHYDELKNSKIDQARIYLEYDQRYGYQPNIDNNYPIHIAWANCIGFNCVAGNSPVSTGYITRAGSIDFTATLNWMVANGVRDGWLMLWSDEGVTNSYKVFQPSRTRLIVDYSNAVPNKPTNLLDNTHDFNGGCVENTSGNCGVSTNVNIPTKNWYDGVKDCNSGALEAHNLNISNFDANSRGWQREITNLSDKGVACQEWTTNFTNWKLNGTYKQAFEAKNKFSGNYSGWGNQTIYTVDNSIPVRIGQNATNIPTFTNGNIAVTAPEFVDDSQNYVTITSVANQGRLDGGGGPFAASGNNPDFSRTYVGPAYYNNHQNWIMEGNGFIRNEVGGKCLGIWEPSGIVYAANNCADASYMKWEYNPETQELKNKYWGWCIEANGNDLWHRACNGSVNQKFSINNNRDWNFEWKYNNDGSVSEPYKQVEYQFVLADAKDGHWVNVTGFNTNRQMNWNLEDSKSYNFWVRTRDRTEGHTANYSSFYLMGSATVDRNAPKLTNFSINHDHTFSPGNLSGGKNNITFSYDYEDATPHEAWLDIYKSDSSHNKGTFVKRLGYDPTIIPTNLPAIQPGNLRQYHTWDGKDASGNLMMEGIYMVEPLSVDKTCIPYANVGYASNNCNATRNFITGTDSFFTLDNTGANIKVSQPRWNIWTNKINYVLDGQVATLHVDGKSDQDISKFLINNVEIPLIVGEKGSKQYQFKTTLALGKNIFNMSTVDMAENIISDVGDPQGVLQNPWIINYENISPKITNILQVASSVDTEAMKTSTTPKWKTSTRLEYSDPDKIGTGAETPVSGNVSSGINKTSININLYRSTDNKKYLKLANIIGKGYSAGSNYLEYYSCSNTYCDVNLKNLDDGYYKLFVTLEDNATNNTCTENEFVEVPNICMTISDFEKVIVLGDVKGNLTPNIAVDNTRGLLGVELIPSVEGVNDSTVLAKLASGELTIDQVQGLTIKLRVAQGVEGVDLSYSYDTNQDPRRIATISGLLDTRTQYNNRSQNVGDPNTGYQNISDKSKFTKCNLAECTWIYTIVYDRTFGGGTFKLVIDSFKPRVNVGTLIETARKDFIVNGVIQTTPKVLRIDNPNKVTNLYRGIFYTNQLSNKIWYSGTPDYTYSFTIGGVVYSNKTNSIGLGTFDVNLTTDKNYPILYKGVSLTSITLDRVAPAVVGVTITNLSNANSVIPFIRSGDQIRWNVELSESVALSSVILENGYRAYGDKVLSIDCSAFNDVQLLLESGTTACNDAWRNSKIQNMEANVSSPEKIYYPSIYGEDFAGNVAILKNTSTTVSYSNSVKGKSGDYRLFVDSTIPDKREIDTSSWNDGKDGVKADGLTPELDRLGVSKYVVRGNTVTLKTSGERNARGVFIISNSTSESQVVNPTYTNCTAGSNPTVGGLITKFGESCLLTYTYTFPSNFGTQKENGEANDSKSFSFYQMDLSGNASVNSTNSVVVYSDKTGSTAPSVNISSLDTTKTFVMSGDSGFTNSNKVNVTASGEMKSDSVYEITTSKGVTTLKINRKGQATNLANVLSTINALDCSVNPCKSLGVADYYVSSMEFALGTTVADTAYNMVGTRRVGTGEDGIYTFKVKDVDTVGNDGAQKVITVERDTIAPAVPKIVFTNNYSFGSLSVEGEQDTEFSVNIYSNGRKITSRVGYLLADGKGSLTGLISLACGTTYTAEVALKDKAGNISGVSSSSITTGTCVVIQATEEEEAGFYDTDPFDLLVGGQSVYLDTSGAYSEILMTQKYISQQAEIQYKEWTDVIKPEIYKCLDANSNVALRVAYDNSPKKIGSKSHMLPNGQLSLSTYKYLANEDSNYFVNYFANNKSNLLLALPVSCGYKKLVSNISVDQNKEIKELDTYLSSKLNELFSKRWQTIFYDINIETFGQLAISIASFAVCSFVTGGIGAIICAAVGISSIAAISWLNYQVELKYNSAAEFNLFTTENLALMTIELIPVLGHLGVLGKIFTISTKFGKLVFNPITRTFIKVKGVLDGAIEYAVAMSKVGNIDDVLLLSIVGDLKTFSVKASDTFISNVQYIKNTRTGASAMKWSQTLSTDFKSGLTSKFGTFTKVLYRGSHSTDPALKALDVIIDSGKTRRVLYDSTKKAILFEDLSNTLKAEQMGILWKAGYTNFNPILKPWVPLILRDGSNLKAVAKGFASKIIKVFDNDTAKVLEDIVLPSNLDDISVMARTNNGFKFNMQFKGKTVEVRIMNPISGGAGNGYPEGELRLMDLVSGNYYSADGRWLNDFLPNGDPDVVSRALTHFHIVGFK